MVQPTFLGLAPQRAYLRALLFLFGTPLLLGAWGFTFGWFFLLSRYILAPYSDVCCASVLFPPGDWQIPVEEFFERSPGNYLLPTLAVVSTAVAFLFRLIRIRERALVPLLLALFNAAFLVCHVILLCLAVVIDAALMQNADYSTNYYVGVSPLILVILIGLIALPLFYGKLSLHQ